MNGRGLVVATEAEKVRGRALQDAITHCRLAAAAVAAAVNGHPNVYVRGGLEEAHETLSGIRRALEILAGL